MSKNKMNRRTFVKISAGSALYLGSAHLKDLGASLAQNSKPNILILLTDQQHLNTISSTGCSFLKTPAMDYLVENGVSFRESYSSNPVCSPARSCIFTGRTSTETGVHSNGIRIRKDIPNMGQWFSENSDYETFYSGKWHLPNNHIKNIEGFQVLSPGLSGPGFLGDASVSRASEAWLRNRTSKNPFLMVASFLQPHDICEWLRINMNNPESLRYPELADQLPPLPSNFNYDPLEPRHIQIIRNKNEPVKGKWSKLQWRYYLWSYYRHIEMVDAEIGRILQALQDTGLIQNTLVMFISDHGEGVAGQQMVRKSNPYDGASTVPWVLSWPGKIQKGVIDSQHLVSQLDMMPTVCDFAGIKTPPKMRGRSLRPILEGRKPEWHEFIVTEMPGNRARLVRTPEFKYVSYAGDAVELFFDRKKDPAETKNISKQSEYADSLQKHKELLMRWESTLDPAPNLPNKDAWWRKV